MYDVGWKILSPNEEYPEKSDFARVTWRAAKKSEHVVMSDKVGHYVRRRISNDDPYSPCNYMDIEEWVDDEQRGGSI